MYQLRFLWKTLLWVSTSERVHRADTERPEQPARVERLTYQLAVYDDYHAVESNTMTLDTALNLLLACLTLVAHPKPPKEGNAMSRINTMPQASPSLLIAALLLGRWRIV